MPYVHRKDAERAAVLQRPTSAIFSRPATNAQRTCLCRSFSPYASFRLIHENFGALLAVVRNSFEEFSQVGHKQTRAPVGRRGIAPDAHIVIGVFLLPGLDEPFAEYIDPRLARVEEEIIGM